jgi:hypothetical protein
MNERPILSLNDLSWKLGIRRSALEDLASNAVRHYHPFLLERSGKKPRHIDNPDQSLKAAQRQIDKILLKTFELPQSLHGGVKGRSTHTNARQHLGQRMVVRVDVEAFFPSITDRRVYSVWAQRLRFSPPVAGILTSLTSYRHRLPQGAPTSSSLANLVLLDVDANIQAAASQANCTYTRFVDDLVFSGDRPQIVMEVALRALRKNGFGISRNKIALMPADTLQEVTGLSVNSRQGPSVPRHKRDQVRAAIHQLKSLPRDLSFFQHANSIRGRIAHFARTNPGQAEKLLLELEDLTRSPLTKQ